MAKPKIVVIGSINMDLVLRVPRLPRPGETLAGTDAVEVPGGKGANQAVAAARLGGEVTMVGRVGRDAFGGVLRAALDADGVDTRLVKATPGPTGVAVILVQADGDNSIVLSAGANARVTVADVRAATPAIRAADAVLLQLEVPLEVVAYAAALCRKLGVRVILDPAPAPVAFPNELLNVDVFCPNDSEAATLLGPLATGDPLADARQLRTRGASAVAMKLGALGSLAIDAEGRPTRATPFKVKVVDTTAAGDSMTAGLAVALAEGRAWPDALRFANAAGALACTRLGAQPSIPTRAQVARLMRGS